MNAYHRAMDFARNLFGWAIVGAIHVGALIIIGFFLNWMGVGGLNYIIATILIPVLAGLFLAPEITVNLLTAAVASGILFPASVEDEVKKFFTIYLKNVQGVILWLSLVFIFLATVPVRECPIAFFALMSTLMLIAIVVSYWNIGGEWARRLTYFGLIFLTFIMVGKLVPNSIYIKVFGTTPAAFFDSSKEDDQADKLDEILKTLKKNPSDKIALANLKKIQDEMSQSSLLGKTVSIGEKIKDALTTPAPAPTAPPQAPSSTLPSTSMARIDSYTIPANGSPPYSKEIMAGNWNVFPRETRVMEVWEKTPASTDGSILISRETVQLFFPPTGTKEIILTRKK